MSDTRLPPLNLPPVPQRFSRGADGVTRIFDPLRQKFVALTPEEWVRQHFVAYLTGPLGYPAALLANEVTLRLNATSRRCDTVLFARQQLPGQPLRPLMIVEYKAPHIEITQRVFDQIARYNLVMGARLLVVSNGMRHFCCLTPEGEGPARFLGAIPDYGSLLSLPGVPDHPDR